MTFKRDKWVGVVTGPTKLLSSAPPEEGCTYKGVWFPSDEDLLLPSSNARRSQCELKLSYGLITA